MTESRLSAAMHVLKLSGLPDKELPADPLDAEEIIDAQMEKRIDEKRTERQKHLSKMDRLSLTFEAPDVAQEEADAQAARQEVDRSRPGRCHGIRRPKEYVLVLAVWVWAIIDICTMSHDAAGNPFT